MQLRLLISNNNGLFHFISHPTVCLLAACACSWAVHQLVCWLEWALLILLIWALFFSARFSTRNLSLCPVQAIHPPTGADVWLEQ